MDVSDRLSALKSELARRLGQERAELWVESRASLRVEGDSLVVCCESDFECAWIRRRLHATLIDCCKVVFHQPLKLRYIVDETPTAVAQEPKRPPATATRPTSPPPTNGRPIADAPAERCSFARFVVGSSNALAHQAAETASSQPGRYCPLLIYGPSGVGKTHLLRAIADRARRKRNGTVTRCITSEQFTAEFLEALDRRALPGFRQKYRSLGALLVDDVQFFAGKRATLDEFLHTTDTLQQMGRQVVLTADRLPGELRTVSPELASRISGGLAVGVEPPDYATRAGIVRALAGRMRVELNEAVVDRIAAGVAGSARLLAGAMNRLLATSAALGKPINASLTECVVAEFTQQTTPPVKLADIQRAVCEVFGIEPTSLKSASKARSSTQPRMLAMWLARKYTRSALSEIGDFFGRRSHSTVISAQQKVDRLVSQGKSIELDHAPVHVEEALRRVEAVLRSA